MGRLYGVALIFLFIICLLNTESILAKKGSSSGGRKPSSTSSRGGTQSKPRQPQTPNRNPNPYPAGGSYPYPGTGNTNPGGYPRQNPGSYPNQNPAAGGYPNQPGRGNYPNQYPAAGGYPNQNPAAGGYPAGGGYPNQPGRGNYPNQNPAAGGYPAGGGYPNQPGRGNYPNQYPAAGGYPNQYPAAGGYPNQYPAAGGYPGWGGGSPGGYPVRGGNTGPGWGSNPGAYPGGGFSGYPNWNPNNKILSPRYGGGSYSGYNYGMGGSAFARSASNHGYAPKLESKGFAKKAMMAAGVGALAGMAVGYGIGRFPRPHFGFRSPQEEYYYNNYMYRHYGSQSTDEKDYGRDYIYRPPPRAETYEKFMDRCMNRSDLLKDQKSQSQGSSIQEDDDTVSIEEIGYPALIDQMKSQRCVERYMEYSKEFLQKRESEQLTQLSRSNPLSYNTIQLFTSVFMLLSSMLVLQ